MFWRRDWGFQKTKKLSANKTKPTKQVQLPIEKGSQTKWFGSTLNLLMVSFFFLVWFVSSRRHFVFTIRFLLVRLIFFGGGGKFFFCFIGGGGPSRAIFIDRSRGRILFIFLSLSLSLSLFTHILVVLVVVVVVVADVVSFLFLSLSLSLSFLFCSWSVFSGPPFLFYFFSDEGIFTTHPVAGIGHKKKQQHQQRAPLFFLTWNFHSVTATPIRNREESTRLAFLLLNFFKKKRKILWFRVWFWSDWFLILPFSTDSQSRKTRKMLFFHVLFLKTESWNSFWLKLKKKEKHFQVFFFLWGNFWKQSRTETGCDRFGMVWARFLFFFYHFFIALLFRCCCCCCCFCCFGSFFTVSFLS